MSIHSHPVSNGCPGWPAGGILAPGPPCEVGCHRRRIGNSQQGPGTVSETNQSARSGGGIRDDWFNRVQLRRRLNQPGAIALTPA
jgi:hypothetical protein